MHFSSKILLVALAMFSGCSTTLSQGTGTDNADYIVDSRYPLIYSYVNGGKFTHFGASVALSPPPPEDHLHRPAAWVFIGAPTANFTQQEEGALWRCSIGRGYELQTMSGNEVCKMINIDIPTKSKSKDRPHKEERDNMWTGGSLEIANNRLLTCGHRATRGDKTYINGLCYFLQEKTNSKSESYIEEDGPVPKGHSHVLLPFFVPLPPNVNTADQKFNFSIDPDNPAVQESGQEWGNGQVGTSLHISKMSGEILLGAPGARMWSGAVVRYRDNPTKDEGRNLRLNRDTNSAAFSEFLVAHRGTKLNNGLWFEYFGYSVSSGRYFDDKIFYAGGAPRAAELTGEVVIFELPKKNVSKMSEEIYKRQIEPTLIVSPPIASDAFGSYFGAVLSSIDVDGDGRDELLVGAPFYSVLRRRVQRGADSTHSDEHWNGDNGHVFVYFFNPNKTINGNHRLQPDIQASGARFGSAISHISWTNAIDDKLNTYLVIGAPYENNGRGAIYIFNYADQHFKLVQKVLASQISDLMLGFGASISLNLDADDNKTPDIAVGAYLSSQIVILRTRPKVAFKGNVTFRDKSRLIKDGKVLFTSKTLTIESCITVSKQIGTIHELGVNVSLTLDKRLNLTKNVPWLKKMHEHIYMYSQTVTFGQMNSNRICFEEFQVTVNQTAIEEIAKRKPYDIIQSIWYNTQTSLSRSNETIIEHKIEGQETLITTKKNGKAGFRDFQSHAPYSNQRIEKFTAVIAPNDCVSSICKPALHFEAEWLDVANKRSLGHGSEIILGSITEIIFKLKISNSGETAIKPNISIQWPRKYDIIVNDRYERRPSSQIFLLQKQDQCQNNHLNETFVYNCVFSEDITKHAPVILEIPLSFKDAYAIEPKADFTIDFSVKPNDKNFKTPGNLTLFLKANFSIILAGSKIEDSLRESIELVPKMSDNHTALETVKIKTLAWKQDYWIRVEGQSSVNVHIQLAFPFQRKTETSTSALILTTKVTRDNVYCHPFSDTNQQIDMWGKVVTVDRGDEGAHEAGGSEDALWPSVLTLPSNLTMETPGFPQNSKLLNKDALLIKCDNDNLDAGFSCYHFHCNVVVRGDKSLELGFEMSANKDEIDAMLRQEEKQEVLVVSYGYATTFTMRSVNDTAQTLFKQVVSPVATMVYVLSILFGLLQFVFIGFVLYKCGFFKREGKEKLQLLKAEARRSVMILDFKPNEAEECFEEQECIDSNSD